MYPSLYFFCVRPLELLRLLPVRGRGGSGGTLPAHGCAGRGEGAAGAAAAPPGANMLTHSSVSGVDAVPQQAPALEFLTEPFLIRDYPLTSLYSTEAGVV